MGASYSQFSTFTLDSLNDNYTPEDKAAFEVERSLTQRKLSKNLKGRSELVWPPALESALLRGLGEYDSLYGQHRTERGLKKWPKRNNWISEFILQETNKLRTSKQVGSRIQQLAAATKDLHLVRFTQPQDFEGLPRQRFKVDEGYNGSTLHHTITVASRSAQYPTLPPRLVLGSPPKTIQLRTLMEWQPSTTLIQGMDPTVDLFAPVALTINSMFGLFKDDEPLATVPTALVPNGICNGLFRYIVRIPAVLWRDLADHRENDEHTEWSLRHVVFPAISESLSSVKPFAEVIYNFFEPRVEDINAQHSPEISLKVEKVFLDLKRANEHQFISHPDCVHHAGCPPPALFRKKRSRPRKAKSAPRGSSRPEATLDPADSFAETFTIPRGSALSRLSHEFDVQPSTNTALETPSTDANSRQGYQQTHSPAPIREASTSTEEHIYVEVEPTEPPASVARLFTETFSVPYGSTLSRLSPEFDVQPSTDKAFETPSTDKISEQDDQQTYTPAPIREASTSTEEHIANMYDRVESTEPPSSVASPLLGPEAIRYHEPQAVGYQTADQYFYSDMAGFLHDPASRWQDPSQGPFYSLTGHFLHASAPRWPAPPSYSTQDVEVYLSPSAPLDAAYDAMTGEFLGFYPVHDY